MSPVVLLLTAVAAALACLPTVPLDTVSLPAVKYPQSSGSVREIDQSFSPTAFKTAPKPESFPKSAGKGSKTLKPKGSGKGTKKSCPPTWKKLSSKTNDKCYKKVFGRFDFTGAKRMCKSEGGTLPMIMNQEEHDFIKSIGRTGMTGFLDDLPFIGLVRDDVVGGLKWLNFEGEGFLEFFEDQEPRAEEGSCFMMAVDQTIGHGDLLHKGQVGHYAAVDCFQETKTAICEIDI